jgi:hypothetical protein
VEYHGLEEKCRLSQFLHELHNPLSWVTLVYYGNDNTVFVPNSVQHQCTKYITIDLHFIRERITVGNVCFFHVQTTSQFTDIFIKG